MRRAVLLGALTLGLALPVLAFNIVPPSLRIPPAKPRTFDLPQARFSHAVHGSFACYRCHPTVFPEARQGFSHAEMDRGAFCARCHDGKQAFAVRAARCGVCHVAK